jgi:hypothetical protein
MGEIYLQMAFGIEEEVLRLEIAMRDALAVQVRDAAEDLLEAAFDFTGRHPALLDRGIEVSTRAELHHLTPMLVFILHEINRLDNVDVVQRRRNAELCR